MANWRQDKRKTAERGYGSRWQKARIAFLSANPLCVLCLQKDRIVASTTVDHIEPHKGDMALFWDMTRWQALCTSCHNSVKKIQEHRGTLIGCDESGNPLDPASPWHS